MSHVYVTGDFHGGYEHRKLGSKQFPEGRKMTKDDYVIIAGDFGVPWHNNSHKNDQHWIDWFTKEKKWTTLFVDGNHDNHPRLDALDRVEKFGGVVSQLSESIFHLRRGEIYTIHEKTFFCFGGALSWDIERRRLGVSYWEEEIPSHREMQYAWENLEKHNMQVDYIIAHTVPEVIIPMIGFRKGDKIDPTCRFLNRVIEDTKFDKYFCGHMHIDKVIAQKYFILYHDIIQIF